MAAHSSAEKQTKMFTNMIRPCEVVVGVFIDEDDDLADDNDGHNKEERLIA